MGSELKSEVPQVFEPGARVAWDGRADEPRVLFRVHLEAWMGWTAYGDEIRICAAKSPPANLRVVAPAPSAGQRWAAGHERITWSVAREQTQEEVVTCARWLLEHGFEYVGEATDPIHASTPITSLEPPAAPRSPADPTPWTVADARRAILDAIRSEVPLHREAFTSALCSMAEFFVPSERMILVAASALSAAEEQLPQRGAIAAWQEELGARAMREVLERAYGKGNAPMLCVDACARYLDRRAGR